MGASEAPGAAPAPSTAAGVPSVEDMPLPRPADDMLSFCESRIVDPKRGFLDPPRVSATPREPNRGLESESAVS